jgi:RHS repeat-associated protein
MRKSIALIILILALNFSVAHKTFVYGCSQRFDGANAPPPPVCCACTGLCKYSPAYIMTGDYQFSSTDLQLPTRGFPLQVTRSYESQRYVDGAFGVGNSSNLISAVTYVTNRFDPPSTYYNEAVILMPNGMINRFRENTDGTFSAPAYSRDVLVKNGDGTFDLTPQVSRTKYHYSSTGKLLSITDEFNNAINYTYDGNGRLSQISDGTGSGRYINFGYGPNNRISSATDSSGRSVYYDYNSDGSLKKFTDAAGRDTHYFYEVGRFGPRVNSITDHWNRTVTNITYDWNDRVATYTEAGETYTYSYLSDPYNAEYDVNNPYRTKKTNSAGGIWYITYEPMLGQIRVVDPDPGWYLARREYYPTTGWLKEDSTSFSVDPSNSKNIYTYNDVTVPGVAMGGSINTYELIGYGGNPDYVKFKYYYDSTFIDKVSRILPQFSNGTTNRNYQEWQYEYFPTGSAAPGALKKVLRVKSDGVLDPNAVAEYTYNPYGQVLTAKDATGAITTYNYNSTTGDLESVIYPLNSSSGSNPTYSYGRDPAGRVTSVTDPLGKITSYTYDAIGRVTTVTLPKPTPSSPLNFVTTYTYDQLDNPTSTVYTTQTDANSKQTKQYFDQYGQMVRSVDALSNTTTFTYDKGKLVSIQDANGNITSYSYSVTRGTLSKTTFPAESSVPQANREESYSYWQGGLLFNKKDRNQQMIGYIYDHINRLRTKCYGGLDANGACPAGSPKITYNYQNNGQNLTSIVDSNTSPSQTWNFIYDTNYRVSQIQGPQTNDDITYTYDNADRVLTYALQAGPTITNQYFADGSLKQINSTQIANPFLYTYTLNGQYDVITIPNGLTRDFNYDDQSRLTSVSNTQAPIGNVASFTYGYDVNNYTGQNTMLGQRTSVTSGSSLTKYYYDGNYQLNRTDYPAGAPFNAASHVWTYDAIGNRLSTTINGGTPQNYTYYINAGNTNNGQRLQSDSTKTYTYDYNGNMVSDGTNTYTWDKDNRLTGITGSVTATYRYDYLGRRFSKIVNTVSSTYIYNAQNLIAERGAATVDYVFGPGVDEPLAMTSGGTTYDYSVAGLRSIAAITTSAGTMSRTYTYDVWGVIATQTGSIANPFTYTARESSEIGLMYYRARYYNVGIGRFVSEDPITSTPFYETDFGPSVEPTEALSVNNYFYVGNEPVRYLDPSGEDSISIVPPRIGPYCGKGQQSDWPDVDVNSINYCCQRHDLCYFTHRIGSLEKPQDASKKCDKLNCDMSICNCSVKNYHDTLDDKVKLALISRVFHCKKISGEPPPEGCCVAAGRGLGGPGSGPGGPGSVPSLGPGPWPPARPR